MSRRQGERNSTGTYVDRGLAAINAVALLDRVTYPSTSPRRAMAELVAPRRAITA